MTYYPDLSSYSHFPLSFEIRRTSFNVGWLSISEFYPIGDTPEPFHTKLLELCATARVHDTMGYHFCEFCENDNQDAITRVRYADKELWLGNGEIWSIGKASLYVAPTLIYHYVTAHNYRPPDKYIESVLTTTPESEEYRDLLTCLKDE